MCNPRKLAQDVILSRVRQRQQQQQRQRQL